MNRRVLMTASILPAIALALVAGALLRNHRVVEHNKRVAVDVRENRMKLQKAQVQNYRSIVDSGVVDVDELNARLRREVMT
jgi:hypothetical protein